MDPDTRDRSLGYVQLLRQGRGLAVLRAREASAPNLRDAVLDACTHFTGYDFQGEGSRAEYLFDVLVAADLRGALEAPILQALENRDHWDREQLLDLGFLFAVDGSGAAERSIQATFVRCVEEPERPGAEQLVRARGLPGLLLAARELGRVLPESGADWAELHPLEVAEAHFGAEAVADTLARAATQEPEVRRYLDAVQRYRAQSSERRRGARTPLPFALTFEGLRAAVLDAAVPPPRWVLRRWGREAPAEEVNRAAEALGAGVPPVLRTAVLRAFVARPFPAAPELLLGALDSGDEDTVEAAWRVLRLVKSAKVRARAVAELEKPNPDLSALQGLERNLRKDDVPLFARILSGITDDDELHFAGLVLLDAVDAGGGPHFASLLLTLYERGICGSCRHSFVKRMHDLGVAPRSILLECRHDACLDLRADAAAWAR